jgi:hypothetical protein
LTTDLSTRRLTPDDGRGHSEFDSVW